MKRTREGGGRGGHRRWLSETPRPHDQCHGAFIVLQQKGAHQSTGISSRLISRGHPLVLAPASPFSFFPPFRSRNPYGSPSFPPARVSLSLAFCSEAPCPRLSFFQPSASPRRPPFGRSVGEGCGRPTGGRRQIAGRRSSAVVMKTYEIYSIWADAITPSADRGGGQPPTNPRGYTSRCMRACLCVSVCTRYGTSSS